MIWSHPVHTGPLQEGAHIGTALLHNLAGIPALWWGNAEAPPLKKLKGYDTFIVNQYADMPHIKQIKLGVPDAYILAVPDSAFDEIFATGDLKVELNFLECLNMADAVCCVSKSNQEFFKPILKSYVLDTLYPHAIGTSKFFATCRQLAKQDYIIATDHPGRIRPMTFYTAAVAARLQKLTGLDILYANATPSSIEYMKFLGVTFTPMPYMVYEIYAGFAARARVGVDMYGLHGMGRNAMTLHYAGTPCVTSHLPEFGPYSTELHDIEAAAWVGHKLVDQAKSTAEYLWQSVEHSYGFEAATQRMMDLLKALEGIREARLQVLP